jgi:hypothetical protein
MKGTERPPLIGMLIGAVSEATLAIQVKVAQNLV